jgi:hypothetical protein
LREYLAAKGNSKTGSSGAGIFFGPTPKLNGSAAFGVNPKDDAVVTKPVVIVITGGNET